MKIPEKFDVQVRRSRGSTEIELVLAGIVHTFAIPDALLGQAWTLAKTLFSKKNEEHLS